jgi:hypothetical protein
MRFLHALPSPKQAAHASCHACMQLAAPFYAPMGAALIAMAASSIHAFTQWVRSELYPASGCASDVEVAELRTWSLSGLSSRRAQQKQQQLLIRRRWRHWARGSVFRAPR